MKCHTCGGYTSDTYRSTYFGLKLTEEAGLDRKHREFCSPDCLHDYIHKTFRINPHSGDTEAPRDNG